MTFNYYKKNKQKKQIFRHTKNCTGPKIKIKKSFKKKVLGDLVIKILILL